MSDRKSILAVDDEAHILHVVKLKLSNAGYDVHLAHDGEEGYEMACRLKPDLIITDFQMPYMTGLEMCRALCDHEHTSSIPVILLTARGYTLSQEDLDNISIVESMTKPFSPRELLARVGEILASVKSGG